MLSQSSVNVNEKQVKQIMHVGRAGASLSTVIAHVHASDATRVRFKRATRDVLARALPSLPAPAAVATRARARARQRVHTRTHQVCTLSWRPHGARHGAKTARAHAWHV